MRVAVGENGEESCWGDGGGRGGVDREDRMQSTEEGCSAERVKRMRVVETLLPTGHEDEVTRVKTRLWGEL